MQRQEESDQQKTLRHPRVLALSRDNTVDARNVPNSKTKPYDHEAFQRMMTVPQTLPTWRETIDGRRVISVNSTTPEMIRRENTQVQQFQQHVNPNPNYYQPLMPVQFAISTMQPMELKISFQQPAMAYTPNPQKVEFNYQPSSSAGSPVYMQSQPAVRESVIMDGNVNRQNRATVLVPAHTVIPSPPQTNRSSNVTVAHSKEPARSAINQRPYQTLTPLQSTISKAKKALGIERKPPAPISRAPRDIAAEVGLVMDIGKEEMLKMIKNDIDSYIRIINLQNNYISVLEKELQKFRKF